MRKDVPERRPFSPVPAEGADLGEAGTVLGALVGVFFVEEEPDLLGVADFEGLDDLFQLPAFDDDTGREEHVRGVVAVGRVGIDAIDIENAAVGVEDGAEDVVGAFGTQERGKFVQERTPVPQTEGPGTFIEAESDAKVFNDRRLR